jgi:hypothetical protein
MLQAAIQTFNVLWLGEDTPKSCKELALTLMESKDRLNEW